MLMLMDCQSHTDLKLDATIFGHMPQGSRKALHMTVTVPANPAVSSPPFVGQDHYCESATRYSPENYQWYTNNILWDSVDCYPGSSYCDNPLAPWFRRTLKEKTTEDIEVRWCNGNSHHAQKLGIELLELYIYNM